MEIRATPLVARTLVLSTLLVLALASGAQAANLIVNGGFETGDYTGWTSTGPGRFAVEPSGVGGWPSHSGNFFSWEGAIGSDHLLSQTFADTAGQGLTIAFWYGSSGSTPNDLNVFWNAGLIFNLTDLASTKPDYSLFRFFVTATGTDTLTIGIRNDFSFQALDDVSVTPTIPEPGTLVLMGSGLLGLAVMIRRKLGA